MAHSLHAKGDHFTGVDLKLYVGERLNGTEPLGDPAQRQHGRSGHVNHLLRRLTGGDAALGVMRGRLCFRHSWDESRRKHRLTSRTCARPVPYGNGCVRHASVRCPPRNGVRMQ